MKIGEFELRAINWSVNRGEFFSGMDTADIDEVASFDNYCAKLKSALEKKYPGVSVWVGDERIANVNRMPRFRLTPESDDDAYQVGEELCGEIRDFEREWFPMIDWVVKS